MADVRLPQQFTMAVITLLGDFGPYPRAARECILSNE
jgi:hypothetical protein